MARYTGIWKALLLAATGLILFGWLLETPAGLLGKFDAVGYAVCHRIASRSFLIGDRPTPLCARCTGMFLGAMLGFAYLSRYGKRAGMPSRKVMIVLGIFLLAFGVDGVNSYLHFFPGIPGLYEPQNWLRLLTGSGLGLGIAALLVPVAQQTIWRTYDGRAALRGWREFLPLIGLAGLVDAAVLSENPLLLYPLALLSGAGVLLTLAVVYGIIWIIIMKRENRFQHYRDLWLPMNAGFLTALLQIAAIDAARFWLTGTWGGFQL